MSISYLTSPNDFSLYSRRFQTNNMTSDNVQTISQTVDTLQLDTFGVTRNANIGTVLSNKIQSTTGSNFFSEYDSTKIYKIGDFVTYQGLFFRCLVNNTQGITPNQNDPAQPEWLATTSNNAILNNPKYSQVSAVHGNDSKANQNLPIPYKTLQAAITASTDGTIIKLIDNAATFDELILITDKNNLTIDGGLNGTYQAEGNTIKRTSNISNVMTFTNCTNITIKNVIIQSQVNEGFCSFLECTNVTFENVVFYNTGTSVQDISIGGVNLNFGDFVFYNCRSKDTGSPQLLNIRVTSSVTSTPTIQNRLFIIGHLGPVTLSNLNQGAGYGNYYFYNCNNLIADQGGFHLCGYFNIMNCQFSSDLISVATFGSNPNNRLVVTNSSLFNESTGTYYALSKTGSCPLVFQNFDYDKNNAVILNGLEGGGIYDFGPPKYMNRYATYGPFATPTNLLANTITSLSFGDVTYDPFNITALSVQTRFNINNIGIFRITAYIEFSTSQGQGTYFNSWIGFYAGGNTEAEGTSQTGFTFPLVSSTATYPTIIRTLTYEVEQLDTTGYYIYFRNLGTTTFTMRLISMNIQQII